MNGDDLGDGIGIGDVLVIYYPVSNAMAKENTPCLGDFPIEASISSGFPIVPLGLPEAHGDILVM